MSALHVISISLHLYANAGTSEQIFADRTCLGFVIEDVDMKKNGFSTTSPADLTDSNSHTIHLLFNNGEVVSVQWKIYENQLSTISTKSSFKSGLAILMDSAWVRNRECCILVGKQGKRDEQNPSLAVHLHVWQKCIQKDWILMHEIVLPNSKSLMVQQVDISQDER